MLIISRDFRLETENSKLETKKHKAPRLIAGLWSGDGAFFGAATALCLVLRCLGSELPSNRRSESGRRQLASGTPAMRGAHNSERLEQQPAQALVRGPIPNRVTVATSVDAFRSDASRNNSPEICVNVT